MAVRRENHLIWMSGSTDPSTTEPWEAMIDLNRIVGGSNAQSKEYKEVEGIAGLAPHFFSFLAPSITHFSLIKMN
jgi:hypothetical protein